MWGSESWLTHRYLSHAQMGLGTLLPCPLAPPGGLRLRPLLLTDYCCPGVQTWKGWDQVFTPRSVQPPAPWASSIPRYLVGDSVGISLLLTQSSNPGTQYVLGRECSTLAGLLSTMGWDSGPMESGGLYHFSLWPERTDIQPRSWKETELSSQWAVCTKLHRVGFWVSVRVFTCLMSIPKRHGDHHQIKNPDRSRERQTTQERKRLSLFMPLMAPFCAFLNKGPAFLVLRASKSAQPVLHAIDFKGSQGISLHT